MSGIGAHKHSLSLVHPPLHAPLCASTSYRGQSLAEAAADLGIRLSDRLIFGTINGVKFAGYAESLNIFEDLPRLVVQVRGRGRQRGQGDVLSR